MTGIRDLLVGRLPYLNAFPFAAGFPAPEPCWVEDVPRRLGRLAAEGRLDAALLASRDALALSRRYRPLADLGIARRGAVESVLLLSRRPVGALAGARVALTDESRTSRALLRILLGDALRLPVEYVEAGEPADACLAIGDAALELRASACWPHVLDLGEAWHRFTGLPFVYAVWVVRRDVPEAAARELARALAHSLEAPRDLSGVALPAGLGADEARRYLAPIVYRLGPAERAGLRRFHQELLRHDLLRHHRERVAIGSAA